VKPVVTADDAARLPDEVPCVLQPGTVDEVDEVNYLAANPDVVQTALGARQHFLSQGHAQGRLQWTNAAMIAHMRERKLRDLRLMHVPGSGRRHGEAVNYVSRRLLEEFNLPEVLPVSSHRDPTPLVDLMRNNRKKLFLARSIHQNI
jgi:hypothetical protein